jgi:hypothetical protein
MAIMASKLGNMGVLGVLVKTVSQFDYPASNESQYGPVAYFPLYF